MEPPVACLRPHGDRLATGYCDRTPARFGEQFISGFQSTSVIPAVHVLDVRMPCIPRSLFGMRIPGPIADGHLEYQAATARRIWESAPWCSSAGHPGILILQLQVRISSFLRLIHPVPRRKPLYLFVTHCILDPHGAPYLAAGHQTLPFELQVLSSSSCHMTSRQPASSGLPSRPGYLLRMDLASRLLGVPQLVWRNEFRIQVHLASFRGRSFGIRCIAHIPTAVMLRGGTVV